MGKGCLMALMRYLIVQLMFNTTQTSRLNSNTLGNMESNSVKVTENVDSSCPFQTEQVHRSWHWFLILWSRVVANNNLPYPLYVQYRLSYIGSKRLAENAHAVKAITYTSTVQYCLMLSSLTSSLWEKAKTMSEISTSNDSDCLTPSKWQSSVCLLYLA